MSDTTTPPRSAAKAARAPRTARPPAGGRPAVDAEKRQSVIVSSRYTPAEYERLARKAAAAGKRIGSLQKDAALERRIVREAAREDDFATVDQLRRIGNNLNQLTYIAHRTGQMPAGLGHALETLTRLMLERMTSSKPGRRR